MIIQIILGAGLLSLVAYAVVQYRRSRLLAGGMILVSLSGLLFVMFPELADVLATAVGVERGPDLIFYCFILVALIAVFNLHLRLRAANEVTTELARAIALISSKEPKVAEGFSPKGEDPAQPRRSTNGLSNKQALRDVGSTASDFRASPSV